MMQHTYTFNGGKIWKNGKFHPNGTFSIPIGGDTSYTKQLAEDDLIVPGLVDFHTHFWAPKSGLGVADSMLYSNGIVAAVDAGSFGYDDWDSADTFWKASGNVEMRSYIAVLPEGLTIYPPDLTRLTKPEDIDVARLIETVRRADPKTCMGVKVQLGRYGLENDRALMKAAKAAADATGCQIMVHVSGAYLSFEELVEYLRSGDVITHIYSGFDNRPFLLDEQGRVKENIFFEAKKQGIVMDVAHAGKHFSWDVYKKGAAAGAEFDTLSTDITRFMWNDPKLKVENLEHIISAMLAAGEDLDHVFSAVLDTPAEKMGVTLDFRKNALVLKKVAGNFSFLDWQDHVVTAGSAYVSDVFVGQNRVCLCGRPE